MKQPIEIGQRFTRLVVLADAQEKSLCGHPLFLCRCDCGTEKKISSYSLGYGTVKSCGCLAKELLKVRRVKHAAVYDGKTIAQWAEEWGISRETARKRLVEQRMKHHTRFQDLSGQRFNMLTVLSFHHRDDRNSWFLVRCDCGKEKLLRAYTLKDGFTKSCGCIARAQSKKAYESERQQRSKNMKPRYVKIPCLRCRKSFLSWDKIKNRLCLECKNMSNGLSEYELWLP